MGCNNCLGGSGDGSRLGIDWNDWDDGLCLLRNQVSALARVLLKGWINVN